MDNVVAKALKEMHELQNRLAEIESFLEAYERYSGQKIPRQNTGQETQSPAQSTAIPKKSGRVRKRPNNPGAIASMAERVIREAGRPLQRGELVTAIEQRGIQIHSEDKPRYIGTILWRHGNRFKNVEGEGYIMKDMAPPKPADLLG